MKTRRMFLIALCGIAMLIGASSCKKEKQENENGETMTIKASLGSADNNSKTHLDGKKVMWDMGDAFKLFRTVSTEGTKFSLTRIDETDGKVAYFEGWHPGDAPYYACYPFNNVSCTAEGTFTFSIPQVQNDSPETVSGNSNAGPMVGYMENASGPLVFHNVMSWLKVGLKGNATITRIVLTDMDGKKLNGTLTVTCSGNKADNFSFTTAMSNDEGTSQLVYPVNGIVLSEETATDFYFLVPAHSLAKAKLEVYNSDEEDATPILSKDNLTIDVGSEPGVPENAILTATVSGASIEGAASVTSSLGCTNDHVYGLRAQVKGGSDTYKSYLVGVCYSSTVENPTVGNCDGNYEIGTFDINKNDVKNISCDIVLSQITSTVNARVYAFNGAYIYADKVVLDPDAGPRDLPSDWTNGENPHPFTVYFGENGTFDYGETEGNDDLQVHFSQGNLQYNADGASATAASGEYVGGTWRFAQHQFDYIGLVNENASADYKGWIDLFCWSTSGWNHGAECYQPWSRGESTHYHAYGDLSKDLNDDSGKADWAYNTIEGAGSGWRSVKCHQVNTAWINEWQYLAERKKEGKVLCGLGEIGGCTSGLILLPDDWDWKYSPGFNPGTGTPGTTSWTTNTFTYAEWKAMEAHGAVFLPASGNYNGDIIQNCHDKGYYWTSKSNGSGAARHLNFSHTRYSVDANGTRSIGMSVRLVKEVTN